MSSAANHAVRSHRSERKKRSALAGFRPQPKPGRSKYDYANGGMSLGLAAMRSWLRHKARQKQRKEDEEETDGAS